ncbi:MAG: hypothetical protein V9E87_17685 [Gemmatimonadales bacterium]
MPTASLFFGYGSWLFAQDEMQVLEHPALGAVREALLAGGHRALTLEGDVPTPVLVSGVERRCRIRTTPDASAGRPNGLYGKEFSRATDAQRASGITLIEPPTVSHIIAIAAPAHGDGAYTREQVETILVTAYTGFRAAVVESQRDRPRNRDSQRLLGVRGLRREQGDDAHAAADRGPDGGGGAAGAACDG